MRQELKAAATISAGAFADRVADAVERKRSQLLVGLDPRAELLPVELRAGAHAGRAAAAEACARFCTGLVDAVCPYVVGVKVQLAFFEALGADGARAFEDVCAYARTAGLIVIADGSAANRSTARAYADAYLESARTVASDGRCADREPLSRERLSRAADRRLPALGHRHLLSRSHVELRSVDVQDLATSDGRRVWHHLAELVDQWGAESSATEVSRA